MNQGVLFSMSLNAFAGSCLLLTTRMSERFDYIEQMLADSAGKHAEDSWVAE